MATQLLIYERAVPVNKGRHGEWSVKAGTRYAFARHVNSVPLMAVEIASAAADYAVVFTGTEEAVMPVVILGIRDKENLFVSADDEWTGGYVPAFLRRYPFVFSSNDDATTFTLCIDEEFEGCNQEGRGERLFDSDGERTQYLENVLNFQREYQAQFNRTKAFCATLKELDLLEPMQAQFSPAQGRPMSLTGFMAVNRDRLKALEGDKLSELARSDALELMYLHIQSMRHMTALAQRLTPETVTPEEAVPPEEAAPAEAAATPEEDAPAED